VRSTRLAASAIRVIFSVAGRNETRKSVCAVNVRFGPENRGQRVRRGEVGSDDLERVGAIGPDRASDQPESQPIRPLSCAGDGMKSKATAAAARRRSSAASAPRPPPGGGGQHIDVDPCQSRPRAKRRARGSTKRDQSGQQREVQRQRNEQAQPGYHPSCDHSVVRCGVKARKPRRSLRPPRSGLAQGGLPSR